VAAARNDSEDGILMENNWEQVKDIFQAVLERPEVEREQYLSEACRGNQSLNDEVRGLLDSFEEDDSFFERAAIGEVADVIIGDDNRLKPGVNLGRYEIKYQLGAGGMGEVFLAEDTELERLVALKILSPVFSGDSDRVRRFVREAKSASALNHPNILTIHEIGQANGLHFIATEYIKGETLRQKQRQPKMTLREILDINIQVATALNAAHEANIIHRDVKPENIMIRKDGLIKVLDFGLAKLVEQRESNLNGAATLNAQDKTAPGLIMGTVAYMSPEQTRAQETDARTDIWSLGVCLYEMIAGFKPFSGETASDTIVSILKTEPPPLNGDTPKKLNRIVQKMLQKNAENRYRNTEQLLDDLKDLRKDLDARIETGNQQVRETFGGQEKLFIGDISVVQPTNVNQFETVSNSVIEKPSRFNVRAGFLMSAAVVLIAFAATAFYYLPSLVRQTSTFEKMRFSRLTFTGDISGEQAAISPDGKYAAFVTEESGKQTLWLRHIATSANAPIIPASDVTYGGVSFSPDGNHVYYSAMDQNEATAVYRIPILGGDARKVLDNVERPISFSPDGKLMAYVQNETSLMTANSDGSNPKLLATAQEGKRFNFTTWSPDQKTIISTVFSSADNNTYLVEISVENGTEKPFNTSPWMRISGLAWLSDKSALIISGRDLETKISQLWSISPEGKTTRITNDLNNYFGASLTADDKSIVSIKHERLSNVWFVSGANTEPARQISFDKDKDEGMSGVALSSEGKIVYTGTVTGSQDLWISNADGTGKRRLTSEVRSNLSPTISPDNRYITFVSDRSGSSNIWRMDMDGNNLKQLTDKPGNPTFPVFSPDSKWIVYQFTDTANTHTVWKINIEGGEPIQLTDTYSAKPVVSPDGNFFACHYGKPTANAESKIAIIPFSGGQPSKILDLPQVAKSPMFRWTADGKGLIYIHKDGQSDNLWKQSLDNSPPESLTNFKSEQIFRFDSINNKFVTACGNISSDVIMISNFN
jgi:eukaryotic-like serine/threonine-protein kinase